MELRKLESKLMKRAYSFSRTKIFTRVKHVLNIELKYPRLEGIFFDDENQVRS